MILNKEPKLLLASLIDAVNATDLENDSNLQNGNLFFEDPTIVEDMIEFNASIVMKASDDHPNAVGQQTFYYNRVNLLDLITSQGNEITNQGPLTKEGLITLVNTKYNILLTVDDFVSVPEVSNDELVTLTIKSNHIVFYGSMSLDITITEPPVELSNLFSNVKLNGFTYDYS